MKSFININGKLTAAADAALPHDNRAFRYGCGLFETMLVRNGQIMLSTYHERRLFDGMALLSFQFPRFWSWQMLEAEILKTARKNNLEPLARVRLQVWDGNGGLYDGDHKVQFLIECFPLTPDIAELNANGLVTGIAAGIYKPKDMLSNLKSSNALIYAVAARQAKQEKWNDTLIMNTDHHIIESTIANIFWVKDGRIFTPPLSEGCVAGTMRQYLLDILPDEGLPVTLEKCTAEMLNGADEIFLTNAIRKIKWIGLINSKTYSYNITKKISMVTGRFS